MKIRWIEDPLQEEDLKISYKKNTSKVQELKDFLGKNEIIVNQDHREFLIDLDMILFFETGQDLVYVHSVDDVYQTKERLYQLEESLPANFIRISKSTIVNINQISALEQKLTSGRSIQFHGSYKITYASRMYFPVLKKKLFERSLL